MTNQIMESGRTSFDRSENRVNFQQIINRVRPFLESNIETKDPRYFGALLESHRTIPVLPTWPHAVYTAADGYAALAIATGEAKTCSVARDMIDYMVREQSPSGCWCGYCGYPKSFGWDETNAPPGSFFNVLCPGGIVQDIIWSPFSTFGTALYGTVIVKAWRSGLAADESQSKRWRQSAQLAFEFVLRGIDDKGYNVECQAWDQEVHLGTLLAVATGITGQERFVTRAANTMKRALNHQLETGEIPYDANNHLSLHYHFLTIDAFQEWRHSLPDHPLASTLAEAARRGLDWAWKTQQQPDGNFVWDRYSASDHKSQLLSTFGLAIAASAYDFERYELQIGRALAFLAGFQNPDGGFPVHLSDGLDSSTSTTGSIIQGLGRIASSIMR